jgi:hypothetical protein
VRNVYELFTVQQENFQFSQTFWPRLLKKWLKLSLFNAKFEATIQLRIDKSQK